MRECCVFLQGEHCYEDKQSITASLYWCSTKLELSPLGFEELESPAIHDEAKDF